MEWAQTFFAQPCASPMPVKICPRTRPSGLEHGPRRTHAGRQSGERVTEAMHVVLIFEDDQAIQDILRMLFEANGFRVVAADTAARGEQDARLHRRMS